MILRLTLIAFLSACCGKAIPDPIPQLKIGEPFAIAQNDGKTFYRIPSAVVVDERILVFVERRENTPLDYANTKIDVFEAYPDVRLVSTIDLGKFILSNPQPIYANGSLVVLFSKRDPGVGGVQMCDGSATVETQLAISNDLGDTWEIKNIHDGFSRPGARQTYVSPTHGYFKDGVFYAAGYASFQYEKDCYHRTYEGDRSFVVRSTDLLNWETVAEAPPGTNEMDFQIGDVISMWSRTYWSDSTRVMTASGKADKYSQHMPVVHSGFLGDRVFYPENDDRSMLVSNNLEGNDRIVVYSGPAGYSNAIEYYGKTFLVFENGDVKFNERVSGVFLEGNK